MKNKKLIILSLLILAVGFAAVSTTLYITGNLAVSTNKSDFDVYFSSAILDGEDKSNELIIDKTHIRYSTNELKTLGDKSELEYEVTNGSSQYNVNATITCAPTVSTDIVSVTVDSSSFSIVAGGTHTGKVIAELLKVQTENKDIDFECKIETNAEERTSTGNTVASVNSYAIAGILKDKDGNIQQNTDLVVYSNIPHEVRTDKNGYFYVNDLEKGIHEIYLKTEDIDVTNKEQVKESSSFGATLTTNNVYKVTKGDFKLENTQAGTDLIDNTYRNFLLKDGVNIGDYIYMRPTKTSYSIPTNINNSSINGPINPSELDLWRVISVKSDGTVEAVAVNASSTKIQFYEYTGTINIVTGVNLLSSQYTNDNFTKSARGITESDLPLITAAIGDLKTENNLAYWIAYLLSASYGNYSGYVKATGERWNCCDGAYTNYNLQMSIRPIVVFKENLIVKDGYGTKTSPYKFN